MKYHQFPSCLLLKFVSCCKWAHDTSFTNLLYFSSTSALSPLLHLQVWEDVGENVLLIRRINPCNDDDNHASDDITAN